MSDVTTSDVEYEHRNSRLIGYLCRPVQTPPAGTAAVLLLHDAFGVSDEMRQIAHRLAEHGHPVLLADVWGDRFCPPTEAEAGRLIGAMVSDRERWLGRVRAAQETLLQQPGLEEHLVVLLGYCFGGSSALEHLRTGADVLAAISIHGGFDLLADDWSAARPARVLVCTGADDPMATGAMRADLEQAMSAAGMDWQTHLYSGTRHAFTSPKAGFSAMPEVVAYSALSSARAWQTTLQYLREVQDLTPPPPIDNEGSR